MLETIIPWDLSLSTQLLSGDGSGGATTAHKLVELLELGGEHVLVRGTRLFAAADHTRDGCLHGTEVLTLANAIAADVRANECTPPDALIVATRQDICDEAVVDVWAQFSAMCLERLHDVSLLRLLVPRSSSASAARGRRHQRHDATVREIAGAAASHARGGAAAQQQAAKQALEDAIAEEHSRVKHAFAKRGPLRLLPFLDAFVHLTN